MFEAKGGDRSPIIDRQHKNDTAFFLQPILDKELTIDDIDNYAFVAVDGLVSLINQKVDEYKATHGTAGWDDKTTEDRALEFYGLEDVDTYLDFLDKKDEEIRNLTRVLKRIVHQDQVITPPDEISFAVVENGNGKGVEDKKLINRTKAVLFILKEDFGVDVENEEQLTMVDGVVRGNMMRNTSYVLIKVPTIGRTILVCDEEGNASYVLNNKVLEKQDISDETLVDFTKTDLNTLITETPKLGKRVVYSKTGFVPRMIDAIKNPNSARPDELTDKMKKTGKYLYPKASEIDLSCKGLAKRLGISHRALGKLINGILPEKLGKVNLRKFKSLTVRAYTSEQQELIVQIAEEKGLIALSPEEGEISILGLSERLGISHNALSKLINEIPPEKFGKVNLRKFKSLVTRVYTQEQQELIIQIAEEKGLLALSPEEGEISCRGLAEKIGIAGSTLSKIIKQIDPEELGEIKPLKFKSLTVRAYTSEQQGIIVGKVEELGLFALASEESELSVNGLAKKLGIGHPFLSKIIRQVSSEELGKVKKKRFGTTVADAYTPEQQEIIEGYVDEWRKRKNPSKK
jgi:plasmid maintenance system antidote protein VapI